MKEITLEDLQELGRLLKKAKSCPPMTEEEILNFEVIPGGATMYPDYESFKVACLHLSEKHTHHQTFCNRDEDIYWTIEL